MLQRKFGLLSGLGTGSSPHQVHVSLLNSIQKLSKSKWSPKQASHRLQFAAHLTAIKYFFASHLTNLNVNGENFSWKSEENVTEIKDLVQPLLRKNDRMWNPYLMPYRVLYGKMDIEVVVISSSDPDEEDSHNNSSPSVKRSRMEPIMID